MNGQKYKLDMKGQSPPFTHSTPSQFTRSISPIHGANGNTWDEPLLRNTPTVFSRYETTIVSKTTPSSWRYQNDVGKNGSPGGPPIIIHRRSGRKGWTIRRMPRTGNLEAERRRVLDEEWAASCAVRNAADRSSRDRAARMATPRRMDFETRTNNFLTRTKSTNAKKRDKHGLSPVVNPFIAGGNIKRPWKVSDEFTDPLSRTQNSYQREHSRGSTTVRGNSAGPASRRRGRADSFNASTTSRANSAGLTRRGSMGAAMGRRGSFGTGSSRRGSVVAAVPVTPTAKVNPFKHSLNFTQKTLVSEQNTPASPPTAAPKPRKNLKDILGGFDLESDASKESSKSSSSSSSHAPPQRRYSASTLASHPSNRGMSRARSEAYSDCSVPNTSPPYPR